MSETVTSDGSKVKKNPPGIAHGLMLLFSRFLVFPFSRFQAHKSEPYSFFRTAVQNPNQKLLAFRRTKPCFLSN
jgi:hypothetical protein